MANIFTVLRVLNYLQTYYHGEPIKVNVSIKNGSSKTIKKVRITGKDINTLLAPLAHA